MPILQGAQNFRDVGGCPTSDGRAIKPGLIYRSQGLSGLTPADLRLLSTLGIRLICDLRSSRERMAEPSRWPKSVGVAWLEFDVAADPRASRGLLDRLRACGSEDEGHAVMCENYAAFPALLENPLRKIFSKLLESEGWPVLIHCSAGKDRTGFAIAMLLSALGVSRVTIFDDYLRSTSSVDIAYMERLASEALAAMNVELRPCVLRAVASARSEYLQRAIVAVEEIYGTLEQYLEVCGLGRQQITVLQQRFVSS